MALIFGIPIVALVGPLVGSPAPDEANAAGPDSSPTVPSGSGFPVEEAVPTSGNNAVIDPEAPESPLERVSSKASRPSGSCCAAKRAAATAIMNTGHARLRAAFVPPM